MANGDAQASALSSARTVNQQLASNGGAEKEEQERAGAARKGGASSFTCRRARRGCRSWATCTSWARCRTRACASWRAATGPSCFLRLGSVPTLVVSSAEVARGGDEGARRRLLQPPRHAGARRLSYDHKDVAFSPYGDYWREMRKLFVVEFLSARRVRAADYAREAEVDKLIGRLSSAGGKAVQLEDHIFGLMDGVIGTVAFGNIYGTEQFAHKKHFHDVLDEAMSAKAGFSTEDYYPNAAGRLVDRLTGAAARRERVFRDLDAFFDTIIDQHLVDPSSRATTPGGHGPDLIDVFVDLMEERRQRQAGSHHFTRDHIKGLLSNVFTASVDTSSVTMVWAMAELIRRPAMLRKAQEEVRTVVDGGGRERVHPDDVSKLRYLKAVVKETLRLHRRCRCCCRGRRCGTPEEFDPDRFDGDDGVVDFNGTHFELVPFGAGRRMCPGMAMGVATMEFTLANLLYCFDWELLEGCGWRT
ncbi:unnamed protein product [Miscanthus lutarioriparius]|uniref:Cytochrome P450 n=1 Tax=Miscanthus lutarioriparius TaxID=422564 RepID=A0A811MMU6_9POAL|nr:unnamed protein product [Miscanthus lutarioriparius]